MVIFLKLPFHGSAENRQCFIFGTSDIGVEILIKKLKDFCGFGHFRTQVVA